MHGSATDWTSDDGFIQSAFSSPSFQFRKHREKLPRVLSAVSNIPEDLWREACPCQLVLINNKFTLAFMSCSAQFMVEKRLILSTIFSCLGIRLASWREELLDDVETGMLLFLSGSPFRCAKWWGIKLWYAAIPCLCLLLCRVTCSNSWSHAFSTIC